jgi:branched-chain amino acid transport system substrate-binding protein
MDVGPPALQAWAESVDAHGGINGHQVHVIVENDGFNPGTAVTEAQTLITKDHVLAIADASIVDAAWAPYAQSAHVPVLGGGESSSSQLFVTNPDFFAIGQTLNDNYVTYMYAAKKVGAGNIGELYCAEAATCQQAVAPFKETARKLHIKVGYVAPISFAAPNYIAQCLAAKQAGVKMLLIADAISVNQHVASDCSHQGYTPTVLEGDGAVAKSYTSAPGIKNHYIGFEPDMPFFVTSTPGAKAMDATLKKYAASTTIDSPNYNEQPTQFWLTGVLFQDAAKAGGVGAGGTPTTKELYKGLYALHGDTLGGMAPPLTFHKGVPNTVNCWYWIGIKDGKFTTPYGLKPVCVAPLRVPGVS